MKIKDQEAAEKYIKLCILLNIWSEYHAVTVQVQRRHINEKKQNFFLYYLAVSRTNKKDIIEKIWLWGVLWSTKKIIGGILLQLFTEKTFNKIIPVLLKKPRQH